MTKIDCAKNNKLAKELDEFLQNQNYLTTLENDLVTVNGKLSKLTLESFLKKTDRVKHKIALFDSDSYLIVIPMDLEDVGLKPLTKRKSQYFLN